MREESKRTQVETDKGVRGNRYGQTSAALRLASLAQDDPAIFGSSDFCVANLANVIPVQGLGDCTAEALKDGSATIFKAEALRPWR
jgi:hypothetical protein